MTDPYHQTFIEFPQGRVGRPHGAQHQTQLVLSVRVARREANSGVERPPRALEIASIATRVYQAEMNWGRRGACHRRPIENAGGGRRLSSIQQGHAK
jgi:hypothetical protein